MEPIAEVFRVTGKTIPVFSDKHFSYSWSFAAKMKDRPEPLSTYFEQGNKRGSRPFPHFDGPVHCIEELFVTGKSLYPVARTLLMTCTLCMLFESRAWRKRIETDESKSPIERRATPRSNGSEKEQFTQQPTGLKQYAENEECVLQQPRPSELTKACVTVAHGT